MKRRYLLSIISICLACVCSGCGMSDRKLKKIGEDALQRYISESFPDFTESMREETGLSDLTFDVYMYAPETFIDYDEANKQIKVQIWYRDFKSDDISAYYTTQYDDKAEKLFSIMNSLSHDLEKGDDYSYTLDNGIEVTVRASFSNIFLKIYTSDETEYEYYHYNQSCHVKVDKEYYVFSYPSSSKTDNHQNNKYKNKHPYHYSDKDWFEDGSDYSDGDDFALDHEDDFEDFDEAYDFWEENYE